MTQILAILASKIAAAISSTALLLLFVSAEINSAPDTLPSWRELPQWLWSWQVHAARLFLNYRNPNPGAFQSATITETHSVRAERSAPDPNQPAREGQKA
jgi:hypothetical protein